MDYVNIEKRNFASNFVLNNYTITSWFNVVTVQRMDQWRI